jgi:hypothetical protein
MRRDTRESLGPYFSQILKKVARCENKRKNLSDKSENAWFCGIHPAINGIHPTFYFLMASHLCHNHTMPSRSSKPKDHDFVTIARSIVEQSIGEKLTGEPLDEQSKKNPAAVALGRLGGAKGGRARAKALSPKRRKQIAQKAARARWIRE